MVLTFFLPDLDHEDKERSRVAFPARKIGTDWHALPFREDNLTLSSQDGASVLHFASVLQTTFFG